MDEVGSKSFKVHLKVKILIQFRSEFIYFKKLLSYFRSNAENSCQLLLKIRTNFKEHLTNLRQGNNSII
ncbi:hypothetical protein BpHYR1_004636 [Brachionus plicatilis]|uniref:Uncharacterized protein n=1 Tax=Brachionus plicatilis TaxID=10195 RepID=A0A3M7S794_BRAPC|nr:hypothetical protein BpHYR1_004636 [Brachionus plicatilis]